MCQSVVAALLAAVAASCSLSVGGLEGGPQGAGGSASSAVSGVTATAGTGEAATAGVTGSGVSVAAASGAGGAGGAAPAGVYVWNSFDVKDDEGTSEVFVLDANHSLKAKILSYQGTSAEVPDTSVSLGFRGTGMSGNPFEELNWYYASQSNTPPYIGKSAKSRMEDVVVNPDPTHPMAFDLQLHPPEGDGQYLYAAFVAPVAGHYVLSGVAARRILTSGDHASLQAYVYTKEGSPVAQGGLLDARHDLKWVVDKTPYDLGQLATDDQIVFEVGPGGDGKADDDAVEIAWTITAMIP